jgi:magnesium and cobalt transporter
MSKSQSEDPSPSWLKQLKKFLSRSPQDRLALIDVLRDSENRNLIDPDVLNMIEGALNVADLRVNEIMIPRVQMVVIETDSSPDDIIKKVIESGHSRFPVNGDDGDEVLGILLAKDLLAYFANDEKKFDIKDIMRPAVFIPESKRLNVLLREFKSSQNHMAIVVDEYGVAGLVTIEDVIEEIVGEIEDEHDIEEEEAIQQHGRDRYTVKAITPIDEFNKIFETELSDDEYDTIGGLVINAFGHLPKRGESIELAGFNIKILRADQRRIHLIKLEKQAKNVVSAPETE